MIVPFASGSGAFWLGLAMLGLTLVPVWLRFWAARRANGLRYQRAWHHLAGRLGLQFEPGRYAASPRVQGRYRGRDLTLDFKAKPGPPPAFLTRVSLCLRCPVPGVLLLEERGLLARWWLALRQRFSRAPEAVFARRFSLCADPLGPGQRLAASGNLRRKLLQTEGLEIQLTGDRLVLLQPDIVADGEHLAFLFDLLCDAARLLESA